MKPRVMILVIFTAFVGMMLAPETIMPINYFNVLLAVTLGAGSSAAINMWFEKYLHTQGKKSLREFGIEFNKEDMNNYQEIEL